MDSKAVLAPGTKLGPFILRKYIGVGAAGQVYEAVEEVKRGGKEKRVAVKVLNAKISDDPKSLQCLKDDLHVYKKLLHPNVGALHSFGRDENLGICFVSMEYIEGHDLNTLINAGKIDLGKACAIFRQILAGLQAAHGVNLMHCDLRPRNIFVSSNFVVKIVNFGVVDLPKDDPNARLEFVAPELRQDGLPNALTDIFSAGVLFRKLLESLPGGFDPRDPVHQIATKMAMPDPRDRYRTMAEVLLEFDRGRDIGGKRPLATASRAQIEAKEGMRHHSGQAELQKILQNKKRAATPGQIILLAMLTIGGYGVFAMQDKDFGKLFSRQEKPQPAATPAVSVSVAAATPAPAPAAADENAKSARTIPTMPSGEAIAAAEAARYSAADQNGAANPSGSDVKIKIQSLPHAEAGALSAPEETRVPSSLPTNSPTGVELISHSVTENPTAQGFACGIVPDGPKLVGGRAFEGFFKLSCF